MKDLIPESDAFLSYIISVNKDYFALTYKRNVGPSVIRFSNIVSPPCRSRTSCMCFHMQELKSLVWPKTL